MTVPNTTVKILFGLSNTGADVFILDDPVRGVLDNVTYLLAGDTVTDVSADVNLVSFQRGRSELIFASIDRATGVVQMNNEDRDYDPYNASSPYVGNLTPGKQVQVSAYSVPIFYARVADLDLDYQVSGRSTASFVLEDALGLFGRQFFDEWVATASQTAGTRIGDVLNRNEVRWAGARDLDAGVTILQGDTVSWGSSVLNYLQLVAQSDLGSVFISRDGVLTFRDRHSTAHKTVEVAFADDGSGVAFNGIGITAGSDTYYTSVTVDAEGLTAQTVTVATATDDGVRTLALTGLLMDTTAQALDMATYLSGIYSTGAPRISTLTVNLGNSTLTVDQIVDILSLDLTSLITVTFTPNHVGAAISETCIVEGIRHDIGPMDHIVTLTLGATDGTTAFILDDPIWGVLDGPGVLAF